MNNISLKKTAEYHGREKNTIKQKIVFSLFTSSVFPMEQYY